MWSYSTTGSYNATRTRCDGEYVYCDRNCCKCDRAEVIFDTSSQTNNNCIQIKIVKSPR